jgi:hypothetical protein
LYDLAWLKIAKADRARQYGFDETKIDGQSTLNQWCLIDTEEGKAEVVTVEAAGILVGGTAREIVAHVKKTWKRGQETIALIRDRLGDDADEFAPISRGGVTFLKAEPPMNDTCNTALLTAKELGIFRQSEGREHYGDEA